jgi:hypothetical protein
MERARHLARGTRRPGCGDAGAEEQPDRRDDDGDDLQPDEERETHFSSFS